MWRKLQTYQNGEELFGLPHTEYPELAQIRKELNLLQKLYKLYNDVIDRVSSYYDIPWGDVNIEEINNELMEFQNRCRKLPKGYIPLSCLSFLGSNYMKLNVFFYIFSDSRNGLLSML